MFEILREAWRSFVKHDGRLLAAALAFYALLAAAPLLMFGLAVAGQFFGDEAVRSELSRELTARLGDPTSAFVIEMVERTAMPSASWVAGAVGAVFLGYASVRLFSKLQSALNTIWGVRVISKPGLGWRLLRRRLVAMAMVLAFGLWLLLIIGVRTVMSVLSASLAFDAEIPGFWYGTELLVAALVHSALVWALFKALPDVWIGAKDVLVGALVTALLLTVGTELIGVYLGRVAHTSAYGAAGALILLLLWLYYVFQMLMFGAEVTGQLARLKGHGVRPHAHAIRVVEHHP